MLKTNALLFLVILFLSACSNKQKRQKPPITNEGRYSIQQDLAPTNTENFDATTIEQWNIKPEPKSRYGNHSPYVVFGKTYYLADPKKKFEQSGIASWYGKKFHGHTTSNMEIFDMYKLTAAHRTLPLPSYVEVTNLENNKKVVVRVNDRGPFSGKRIIDLSWAAAKALDYDTKGLANVHIKLIKPSEIAQKNKKPKSLQKTKQEKLTEYTSSKIDGLKFLQVGAFSQHERALNIASELSKVTLLPVHVTNTVAQTPLYRVRIGPLTEDVNIVDIIQKVHNKGFNHTKLVVE